MGRPGPCHPREGSAFHPGNSSCPCPGARHDPACLSSSQRVAPGYEAGPWLPLLTELGDWFVAHWAHQPSPGNLHQTGGAEVTLASSAPKANRMVTTDLAETFVVLLRHVVSSQNGYSSSQS